MADQNENRARIMGSYIPRTAGPWLSEADQVYDAETIFGYIDGAGEVYRSYNMKLLVSRSFHKDGKPGLVADIFDMGTSADAFGVFTHDLDGEDAGIGQGSNYKAGLLSFWKDRYFGSVYAEEETEETKAAVLELGREIASAIPGEGPKPVLLAFLPAEGLETGRVCFFHNYSVLNYHFFVADKDILLLDQSADVVLAPYVRGEGKSYLLLVRYPDEAGAARALESFLRVYMPDASPSGTVRTEDGKWTAVLRKRDILAVAFNEPSEIFVRDQLKAAGSLIDEKGRGTH